MPPGGKAGFVAERHPQSAVVFWFFLLIHLPGLALVQRSLPSHVPSAHPILYHLVPLLSLSPSAARWVVVVVVVGGESR